MHRFPIAVLSIAAATLLLIGAPALAESGASDQPAAATADTIETATAGTDCGTPADPAAGLIASEVEPAQCTAAATAAPLPEPAQGPPFLRGFCQCGCGIGCETSADCGGAPCRRFVTCC